MWVVIVNVFSSSPTSDELREAKEFEEIVDSTMNDGTRDVRVDVRGVDDIANLLFAPRWGYDDEKAMIAFDHIDIFFIRGSIAILPWFKSMRPLLLLMQQCLVCHTPTFTSGFGTLLSTYALATDSLVTNIVNGYALGSPLKDITLIPPPERSPYDHDIRSFDMFADEISGDLFSFHYGLGGWLPHVNCGFRRWNIRSEDPSRATSSYTYKADVSSIQAKAATSFSTGLDDIVVRSLYKWNSPIMVGVKADKDFRAETKCKWRINEELLEVKYGPSVFRVLADHEVRGPMIFELHDLFSCHFAVKPKYPSTIAILRGFITNKIALLEAQLRTGVKASTLKSQTYLNKQVVDGASVIAAAKVKSPEELRVSTSDFGDDDETEGAPEMATAGGFTPSAALLRSCPELRTWKSPAARSSTSKSKPAAAPEPAKRKFNKWAGVREKILEIARAAIRAHPRPKEKVTASDIIQAFKTAAAARIRWSEAPPEGKEQEANSSGRWRTFTIHRSDKLFVPSPDAGTPESNLKLSYVRRTGLERSGSKQSLGTAAAASGGMSPLAVSTAPGGVVKSPGSPTKLPAHIRKCQPQVSVKKIEPSGLKTSAVTLPIAEEDEY